MLSLLKRTFSDFSKDDCAVQAAALAYYTIFALPPLLVLLILLAGAIWDPADVQRAMETQFASLVGSEGGRAVQDMLRSADRPGGSVIGTVLGVAGLLFGATGAFLQLQSALNRAWEVKPDPKQGGIKTFVSKRVLSVGMILGVAFLIIVSLALSALLSALGSSLTFFPEPALHVVDFVVSFAVLTVLFAAMFKILPDAKVAWRDVWVGAAVTTLLFVVGKFAIGLYLGRSEPGSPFGAAGALAVILIWTYYAGMIVLFGAEFTQAWVRERGRTIEPEEGAVRADTSPGDGGGKEKRQTDTARAPAGAGKQKREKEKPAATPVRSRTSRERQREGRDAGSGKTLGKAGIGTLAASVGVFAANRFLRARGKRKTDGTS